MNKKPDRRIQKTRAALFEALTALLQEKQFHEINIKDLTDKANVARQTFYRNYSTIHDILLQELDFRSDNFMNEINDIINRCEFLNDITEILFNRWNDNSGLFMAMYKAEMDNFILDRFTKYAKEMMDIVNKNSSCDLYMPCIFYFAGGAHSLFKNWLLTGRKYPIREMSDIMAENLFPLVTNSRIKIKK